MSNSDKEDILKYVTPPSTVAIVGVVFFVLSLPGFFITKAITSDNLKAGVVCGVMAVMGIVFICLKYYYLFYYYSEMASKMAPAILVLIE